MSTSDDRYDPGAGPRDRSLRVGDEERDAVGEILRRRHLEGRLDTDELQARLERCLAAKTYAELDELVADFPREGPRGPQAGGRPWRAWRLALVLLPLVLVAGAIGGGHLAWLAIPLFFLFVVRPLVWRRFGGGSPGAWACGPGPTTRA